MELKIQYGRLEAAIRDASRLSTELYQYGGDLTRKVSDRIENYSGGSNQYLNRAQYYVDRKLKSIAERRENAQNLHDRLQNLHNTAKRVDQSVARMIRDNQDAFFRQNPDLKPHEVITCILNGIAVLKQFPVIGEVIDFLDKSRVAVRKFADEARHYFSVGAGSIWLPNAVDIVVKTGLAVAAVCAAAAASGGMAIPAVILAGIAVVDALVNTETSMEAIRTGQSRPALAKIYSDRDSLASALRETNFKNRNLNQLSNVFADGLEVTETVCELFFIAKSLQDGLKYFKGKNLKRVMTDPFRPRDAAGRFAKGKKSVWNVAQTFKKEHLLGRFSKYPKKLAEYSKMASKKQIELWGDLIKDGSEMLDKVNMVFKRELPWNDFLLHRVTDMGFAALDSRSAFEHAGKVLNSVGVPKLLSEHLDFTRTMKQAFDFDSDGAIRKLYTMGMDTYTLIKDRIQLPRLPEDELFRDLESLNNLKKSISLTEWDRLPNLNRLFRAGWNHTFLNHGFGGHSGIGGSYRREFSGAGGRF